MKYFFAVTIYNRCPKVQLVCSSVLHFLFPRKRMHILPFTKFGNMSVVNIRTTEHI